MVTFLWRAAGCPEPQSFENPFTDVKQGSFYYNAVLWAARQGITTGTTATKFNPDGPCTRAQIVTFLYRYFVEPEYTNPNAAYELTFWTFQALHVEFMEKMVEMWNEKHPDELIMLDPTVYDFEDMHTKLGLCLERGEGAPDMVDIEIGKINNFIQGNIRLEPLNDIVDARVDIYAKGGNYYGICYHTGAAVMYYNTELCEKAGIDWRSIDTWDEYYAAGEKLKKAFPDKYWSSVETSDIWHIWGQLAELGADLTDKHANITLDTPEMAKVLEYNRAMVDTGLAVVAPGTYHHAEEFYSLMDEGNIASVAMPFWYIDRFPYYMPDLKGKIATRPLPVWEEGKPRSVGQGGTATSITNQAKDMDLVKRFLSYAKLSADGNIQAWNLCGFDPIRTEVWEMEEVTHADNMFTRYYVTNPFDALVEIKDEIVAHNNNENLPAALDAMKIYVLYRAYTEPNVDIPAMLAEEQAKLG